MTTGPTKKMTAKEAIASTFRHFEIDVPPMLIDHIHSIMVATVKSHNDEANRLLKEQHAQVAELTAQVKMGEEALKACQEELARYASMLVGRQS